jgi:hypothetical protein
MKGSCTLYKITTCKRVHKMVLGRGFLYCVYDAKNIIHIIQRRQHGLDLDGTGGEKTLPSLLLLPLKKIAS